MNSSLQSTFVMNPSSKISQSDNNRRQHQQSQSECFSEEKQQCSICFDKIEKTDNASLSNGTPKLYKLCHKYLHTSIVRQKKINRNADTDKETYFPILCQKCTKTATELADMKKQLEDFQTNLADLVFIFSLEILHRRGKHKETAINETINRFEHLNRKKIIEVDIDGLPGWDDCNISNLIPQSLSFVNTDSDHSDYPLIISGRVSDNNTDIKIQIEENETCSGSMDYLEKIVNQTSIANAEESTGFFRNCCTLPTFQSKAQSFQTEDNNLWPTVKLERLQFHSDKHNNHSIVAKGKSAKTKTIWRKNASEVSYSLDDQTHAQHYEQRDTSSEFQILPPLNTNFFEDTSLTRDGRTLLMQLSETPKKERNLQSLTRLINTTDTTENISESVIQKTVGKKRSKCEICNKVVRDKSYLKIHKRIHTGERPFKCLHCQKTFATSTNLSSHQAVHREEKLFKCSICNVRCSFKHNLKKHISRHHTLDNPNNRDLCDFVGSDAPKLKVHNQSGHATAMTKAELRLLSFQRRKLNTGKFKCPICHRRLFSPASLKRHHSIVHKKEKPYKCNICGKRFSTKTTLVFHIRIHTEEKPHKCDQCEYSASRPNSLKLHKIYIHSEVYSYECRDCGKLYKTFEAIKRHCKTAHFALDFSDDSFTKIN